MEWQTQMAEKAISTNRGHRPIAMEAKVKILYEMRLLQFYYCISPNSILLQLLSYHAGFFAVELPVGD